ncbi:RHS repeat-associated core domain-containing protein, partial [Rothia nasimurium]|uniref:RHS repeat-associated core domain-containing protein n=2 Tax=Rothia nasimurium TaxID=85336 RepID=UPI0030155411
AGSLQVAGLEILGVRVYDPVARGFISVDPLASPAGAGWGANVYAFVGNAPVGLVDPWGLSPMTAGEFREYRQDTRGRAWTRVGSNLADGVAGLWDWTKDNWQGIVMVGVGIAATVALGPVAGGIIGGALISGGISSMTNKNADGSTNWHAVLKDAVFGGIAGGVGGLAVKGIGALGSTISSSNSATAFAGSVVQANRAAALTDDALAAWSRGAQWAQWADDLPRWRIVSRTYAQRQVQISTAQAQASFSQASAAWSASDDLLRSSASYYDQAQYFAGSRFVDSVTGRAVQGAGAGGAGNALQYTMPNTDNYQVREDWNMRGVVFAGGVGMGTGVATVAVPGLVSGNSKVADITEFGLTRGTEFAAGGINNSVTTTDENKNDDFAQKGIEEMAKGIISNPGDIKKLVQP